MDYNTCSVPHCAVTRNTLSKWRLAAMELYGFPSSLPLNLHICPEADLQRWISELDLDPRTNEKVSVCSLHFKEGYPASNHPLPTELINEKLSDDARFSGDAKDLEDEPEFTQLLPMAEGRGTKRKLCQRSVRARRKRRRWIPALTDDKNATKRRTLQTAIKSCFGSRHPCRYCNKTFVKNKEYFQHVRSVHFKLPPTLKEQQTQDKGVIPEPKMKSQAAFEVSDNELPELLSHLYPKFKSMSMKARKKYVCAVCKSVCDLFGLFTHMKQVHKGLLCQYCLKLFKRVDALEGHLKKVHKAYNPYYHSTKQLAKYSGEKYTCVCSVCNEFVAFGNLEGHKCNQLKKAFDCPFCDRNFGHQNQLELHLANGWCKEMPKKNFSQQKLYKVLTGQDMNRKSLDSKTKFNPNDRNLILKYSVSNLGNHKLHNLVKGLPSTGTVYSGSRARGISSNLRKELRETGVKFELRSSDEPIYQSGNNFVIQSDQFNPLKKVQKTVIPLPKIVPRALPKPSTENKENDGSQKMAKLPSPSLKATTERMSRFFHEKLRTALSRFSKSCLVCLQAMDLSVDMVFLLHHMNKCHAKSYEIFEEDPALALERLKKHLKDSRKNELIFDYQTSSVLNNQKHYLCSHCADASSSQYSELLWHLENKHSAKVMICQLCQNIFLNYGSFKSHVCYGQSSKLKAKFSCKICDRQNLQTFLEFQYHVRKTHNVCEICFTVSFRLTIFKAKV